MNFGGKRRGASVVSKILCLVPEKASLPSDSSICIIRTPRISEKGALTICMENPVILRRIQMERFIPMEIFRKKVIPFEILPFSRFYRNDRNFLYRLSGLLVRLHVQRTRKFTGIL